MTALPLQLPVSGTASRPSFLSFMVLGHNNLNPSLTVDHEGLRIRVVRETRLGWRQITSVDVRSGLRAKYVVLASGGWDYLAYFRDESGLQALLRLLAERGVPLLPAARAANAASSGAAPATFP